MGGSDNNFQKRNLSPKEAAAFLGCSLKLIYRLIQDGELPAFPLRGLVRGALRIPREAIEQHEFNQAKKHAERNGIVLRFPLR